MGTWGIGIFDNDAASDYATSLIITADLSILEETISRVLESGSDYLEASDGQEVIGAADIIARLIGRRGEQTAYTTQIDAWITSSKLSPSSDLIEQAKLAVKRTLTEPSEILELWGKSGDFESWKGSVEAVLARLSEP